MTSKPTGGPYRIAHGHMILGHDDALIAETTAEEVGEVEQAANTEFIFEAFNVYNATGLGPRELLEQNKQLRRLLAIAYSGINLYGDAGEMQDSLRRPHIDYVRMTPEQIEAAFHERGKATLESMRSKSQ